MSNPVDFIQYIEQLVFTVLFDWIVSFAKLKLKLLSFSETNPRIYDAYICECVNVNRFVILLCNTCMLGYYVM